MIYTKTGDKGETSLANGQRIKKHNIRVEAYGDLDELCSFIGLIRDIIIKKEKKQGKNKVEILSNPYVKELAIIMNKIFVCGLITANPQKTEFQITDDDIYLLEKRIDLLEKELPVLRNFVLPTGYYLSSNCHIARTVARRTERRLSELNEQESVDEYVLKYINRLSDYLFVVARKFLRDKGREDILFNDK